MTDRYKVTTPPTLIPDSNAESALNLFDKDNVDKNLFNSIDDELIKLSGSMVYLYKYSVSQELDPVYMESRNKTIAAEPVILYAHYDPRAVEESLGQYGLEHQNDQIFVFNKSYAEMKVGRSIIAGDILAPAFQKIKYRVFEVQEDSFESYGIYHLVCTAKILRDTEAVQDQPMLDLPKEVPGRVTDNG